MCLHKCVLGQTVSMQMICGTKTRMTAKPDPNPQLSYLDSKTPFQALFCHFYVKRRNFSLTSLVLVTFHFQHNISLNS